MQRYRRLHPFLGCSRGPIRWVLREQFLPNQGSRWSHLGPLDLDLWSRRHFGTLVPALLRSPSTIVTSIFFT